MPASPASAAAATSVEVAVGAKINLFLSVRGTREDGYHDIVSIMQTVSLRDRVIARLEHDPASLHPAYRRFLAVTFSHDGLDGVPGDRSNLVVRAAEKMIDAIGGGTGAAHALPPIPTVETELRLTKQIPVAGGMAGGSADAAATLVALNALWDGGMDRDELRQLAAELGADVPFCVTGGTALATGTGTAIAQVICHGPFHWVVGISDAPLATPEVYRTFDEVATLAPREPDDVLQALRSGDAVQLGTALHNDLQVAAFHLRPGLSAARDAMLAAGALGAIVSGSGPTMLALAEDRPEAERIAREVAGIFDRTEVVSSPFGGPSVTGGAG